MKKKLTFIGMIILALVLTTGTFAYTYSNNTTATLNATLADTVWTTYEPSTDQPDWGAVLPEDENGSEILLPVAAGDQTTVVAQFPDSGEHWDKVDESAADDSATYISTQGSNSWQGDLYQLSDISGASGTETINSVTVFVRYASAGSWTSRAMAEIKIYDQIYSGPTEQTTSTDFGTISWQNDTNPATGEPWTWEEVDALQAGVAMKGPQKAKAALCTQVYVQVDYVSGGISQGELPTGNLYDITPHPEYTGDLLVKLYLTNTAELLKAFQYMNIKIYVANSVEAGNTPNYKILSIENGVVEFSLIGGSAEMYTIYARGGSYRLISEDQDSWETGWDVVPEFYCEVTQR